jgi:hypothetical protein
MLKKKIVYLFLAFLLTVFLATVLVIKETFITQEEQLTKDINSAMTVFSDVLCPTYNIIIQDIKTGLEGSDGEKAEAAINVLEKEAKGTIFTCPPPNNPIQIPANINERIQRTIDYFLIKLENNKKTLLESMGKCEGFQDICPPPAGKSTNPPPPPDVINKNCVNLYKVPKEDILPLLKIRYSNLSNLIKQPQIPEKLAKIKLLSDELLEIKRKAEAGELKPNCP